MWIFFTKRLRRWVLLAIAFPAIRLIVRRLALAAQSVDHDDMGPVADDPGIHRRGAAGKAGDGEGRGHRSVFLCLACQAIASPDFQGRP